MSSLKSTLKGLVHGMADKVVFEDYTIKCQNAIKDAAIAGLEEAAGELVSQTKRRSRVGSPGAKTKNSFQHKIIDSELTAYVGSPDENAIWEEFGTGEHAIAENGGKGGRKGAWYVPVEKVTGYKRPTYNGKVIIVYGKGGQKFYKTNGKKPSRAFWKAFTSSKQTLIKIIEAHLKGL
jgi:hypothetical protein